MSHIENEGEWYIEFPAPPMMKAYVLRKGKFNPDINKFFDKYQIESVTFWDEDEPPKCVEMSVKELDRRSTWWFSPCGHGSTRVDLDLEGNVYECPHKLNKIGTIYNYEHIAYEKPYIQCTNCKLFACCKARCDIEKDTRRLHILCEETKKEYIPILEGRDS
jgi:radical SAM protein with 4Fe4S-binding SPASM domain